MRTSTQKNLIVVIVFAISTASRLQAQFMPPPVKPTQGSVFDSYAPPPNAAFLAELQNKAEQGDAQSQYALGIILFYGQLGLATNKAEAASWWHKSAEQGHAWAENDLGVLYETGNGVEKNLVEAARLYRQSAEQGYARAQNNLGVLLQFGKGMPKNETEAALWYQKAAEQEYPDAENNLAYMYANGKGVETNFVEAMAWWSLAADQSNKYAQASIQMLLPEMTAEQLKQAKQKIKTFRPANTTAP